MTDATVIIATYNRSASLARALESLACQEVPAGFTWDVLIVDNNSTDLTRRVVEARPELRTGHFRYIFEGRQGKSYALNAAIAVAQGEVLAFTDDDVTLDRRWLAKLVSGLRASGCSAAGGRIRPTWTQSKPRWLELEGPYRLGSVVVNLDLGDAPCDFTNPDRVPLGANMAVDAAMLKRLGGFRTDLGPTGRCELRGEDSELCRRLIAAGERLIYLPDAVVYHPVDNHRLDRGYFQKYYFGQGRAITREEGIPRDAARVGGVPRYLVARAGAKFVRWVVAVGVNRRFYHKLQFYYAIGRIVEARNIAASGARDGFTAATRQAQRSRAH